MRRLSSASPANVRKLPRITNDIVNYDYDHLENTIITGISIVNIHFNILVELIDQLTGHMAGDGFLPDLYGNCGSAYERNGKVWGSWEILVQSGDHEPVTWWSRTSAVGGVDYDSVSRIRL